MRRLVVCDAADVSWAAAARAASRPDDRWDILPLRVGPAWFEAQAAASLRPLDARVLDVAALADAANRDVSAFLVDTIHRLPSFDAGGSTVGALLQQGGENLWWSLEIGEKSAFRGRLIERLYGLALIDQALRAERYDEVWLRIGDPRLAATVGRGAATVVRLLQVGGAAPSWRQRSFAAGYWLRAAAALSRFAAVRVVTALLRWPVAALPGSLGILTLYPSWWIAPFGSRPADRFFSAPPPDAHYAAWLTAPAAIWTHRRAVRAGGPPPLLPLQRFVSWGTAARVLSPRRFRELARARTRLRGLGPIAFRRFDVSSIIADELSASMADAEVFFDRLLHAAVTSYLRAIRPSALLYRVECQPWEHAVVRAARASGTPAVGFFHSMYGDNYPALRFAPGEAAGADHGAGPRPLPERMIVPGARIEAYLTRDGYRGAIARCGPQRHASFIDTLASRPSRERLRDRLQLPRAAHVYFVALAIVEVETEGLFACLEHALADERGPVHVLIKTHPNRPGGDAAMRAAVASLGRDRVTYVPPGGDMYAYLAAADTMVCVGSTVAFEAIALGVMPVAYEHPGTFAATSLRAFEEALFIVRTPAEMRLALADCLAGGAVAQRKRAHWAGTLADVFGDMRTPLDAQLARALVQLEAASRRTEVGVHGIR